MSGEKLDKSVEDETDLHNLCFLQITVTEKISPGFWHSMVTVTDS